MSHMKQKILGISFIIMALLTMMMPLELTTPALKFSCTVLFLGGFIVFYTKYSFYDLIFNKKNRTSILFCLVLSILFILILSFPQAIKSSVFSFGSVYEIYPESSALIISWLFKIFFFPLLFLSVFVILLVFFRYAAHAPYINHNDVNKKLIIYLLPVIVVSIIFAYGGYPYLDTPDTKYAWEAVMNNSYSDWHGIGYVFFLKACSLLYNHPFSVNVVESILWIYINYFILRTIQAYTNSYYPCKVYTLLSLIIFTPYLYLQTALKDVVFSMSMLAFCGALFKILTSQNKKYVIIHLIHLFFFGTLVSLFRHGGLIQVIGTLIVLFLYCIKYQKTEAKLVIITSVSICAVFFIVVNVLGLHVAHMEVNPGYVKYSTPMNMVAAIAHSGVPLEKGDIAIMEEVMPIERWKECYAADRYYADNLGRTWGAIGEDIFKLDINKDLGPKIIKLNLKFLVQHPKIYINALLDLDSILWQISTPLDGYEQIPFNGSFYTNDGVRSFVPNTMISVFILKLGFLTINLASTKTILFRGGIWLFNLLACGILLHLKGQHKLLIIFIPPTIMSALFIISIPSQDPRYILPLIECGIFFLIISIFCKNMRNKSYIYPDK